MKKSSFKFQLMIASLFISLEAFANHHPHHTGYSGCWFTAIGCVLLWWFVASALLFYTWNRVIASLGNVKKATFWQALLLVATLSVFCAPRYLSRGHGFSGMYGGCSGSSCPYSHGKGAHHGDRGHCTDGDSTEVGK